MTQKSCFSNRYVSERLQIHAVSGNGLISTKTPAERNEATYRTTMNRNKPSYVIFTNFAVSAFDMGPACAVGIDEEISHLLSRNGNYTCKVFKECT